MFNHQPVYGRQRRLAFDARLEAQLDPWGAVRRASAWSATGVLYTWLLYAAVIFIQATGIERRSPPGAIDDAVGLLLLLAALGALALAGAFVLAERSRA